MLHSGTCCFPSQSQPVMSYKPVQTTTHLGSDGLKVFAGNLGCEVLGPDFSQTTPEGDTGGVEESHLSMQPGGKPVKRGHIQPEKGSEQ